MKASLASSIAFDERGLLCGFLFLPGAAGRPLALEEASAWLAAPPAERQGFVWLHFNLTDASAERWMQDHAALPTEFYEALRQGSRSTRIEDAQDHLLAVVNDVAYEFSFDPSEIKTLWLAVREQAIVSARTHPLRSVDRLREAVKQGFQFDSPVALLNHLFHDQGDVLVRIVRDATVRVDTMEDSVLQGHLRHTRADLGKLRRVLVRLQRLLAPEPGALFRLLRQPPALVRPDDIDELRQATEEFSLVIRDLAALQERIKLLQEELVAQVGEQTNRSVFTLTVVTVLALPINIIAGLFGMNVGGVPLAQNEHGFMIIGTLVAGFMMIAGWFAFRKKE